MAHLGPTSALVLLLLAGSARADEVRLVDGGRIEGAVTEVGDEVRVETAIGVVSVARVDVASIERGDTGAVGEYRARAGALARDDVQGWLRLAAWARAAGLSHQAVEAFEHVLAVDPVNAEAHRGLGHVAHEGRWITEAEAHALAGEVFYGGRWVKAEEADAVWDEVRAQLEARAEARARRATPAPVPEPEQQAEAEGGWPVGWAWSQGWGPGLRPYGPGVARPRPAGPVARSPRPAVAPRPAPTAPKAPAARGPRPARSR
ncbi:MAG: hypothetical protein H6730_28155 [Deltaproteobacteria bacterium]|nr:hypothetical protein [Deltaproteobacteria bacterium]